MKLFVMCGCVGFVGFVIMGYATGFIQVKTGGDDSGIGPLEGLKSKCKFPQDLAPAARAQPVPEAAAYELSAKIYPMVIMKPNGQIHHWQENMREEWQAETVETTQLVLVVGTQKERFINRITYPNGAPPVDRYQYELEVSVVEAKTGKVLANRLFHNVPRPINKVEDWGLTKIGEPVQLKTVFNWVVSQAKAGFPRATEANPLVTVVGK